jgi:hypothetical protein
VVPSLDGGRLPGFERLGRRLGGVDSKFKDLPRFAREASGYICLQDHGDDVWFRNIRIRPLDSK